MRRRRALWATAGVLAAAAVLLSPQISTAASVPAASATAGVAVYRVPAASDTAVQQLIAGGFDLLEKREGQDLFVLGDAATAGKLKAAGFSPTVDSTLSSYAAPAAAAPKAKAAAAPIDETYFGGYHTVKAQYAHLDSVAAANPKLARVVDFGDSYLKTKNAAAGYDMKAVCITHLTADSDCKLSPAAPRPRFVLMTQMHAREIVTGDMSWRFIDYLTQNYGKNTEVTNLLNGTEVWVVPIANPDGVDLVQKGGNRPYLQRKNLNGTGCPNPPGNGGQVGVDLNRNTSTHWGTTGISRDKCSEVYLGPAGDSEAETKSLQWLYRSIFPDQKGPSDTEAAPVTAKGTLLSMHSFAGTILFPWGWDNRKTPNDAALRAIGNKLGQLTGYDAGQPGEVLYNASGNIEDWVYSELGIASFTIEADSCNSFTPAYSCTAGQFTKLLPALMYVAGKAKAPYKL